MASILFKDAGLLVSSGKGFSYIPKGYLGVEGEYIDYIGQDAPEKEYGEVVLINSQRHRGRIRSVPRCGCIPGRCGRP